MAPNVGKHVTVFARAPVLKIRVAVVVRFNHLCLCETEFSKLTRAISFAGHQIAVVESLVIFHTNDKTLGEGFGFDLDGLGVLEHQRFYNADVLVEFDSYFQCVVVQLVGKCDDANPAFWGSGKNVVELVRKFFVGFRRCRVRMRCKTLTRKCLLQRSVILNRLKRRSVKSTDMNFSNDALTLHLVNSGQQLNLRNHTTTDNCYLRFTWIGCVGHISDPFAVSLNL